MVTKPAAYDRPHSEVTALQLTGWRPGEYSENQRKNLWP